MFSWIVSFLSALDLVGWAGNVFIVYGLWGVGNKYRPAFLASIIGESFWIANAYRRSDWALGSICVVFLAMALRAYYLWGKNECS